MIPYLINVLLALDQFANALTFGDPDETLSSRAGKKHPKAAKFINWLFRDPEHCAKSREGDEGSRTIPAGDRAEVFVLIIFFVSGYLLLK